MIHSASPTPQAPVGSGFGQTSTAQDIIRGRDLSGKVAVVTGGYSGIGLETTRALEAAGAHIIVPARDPDRARIAVEGIRNVEVASLDLFDPVSIDAFASRFLGSRRPIHLLVNNAGIMAAPLLRDSRGYESQFVTNHLGHFQLTLRLWPALQRAGGARVISVSSRGHRFGGVNFEDPNFERREYNRWAAYGQSKTANILFAVAADRRGKHDGVRAFSLHPGRIVDTNLKRYMSDEEISAIPIQDESGREITTFENFIKTVQQGAATSVWCATSPQLDGMGGVYCEDCDVAPAVAADSEGLGVRPYATDPDYAERLWQLSEQLTSAASSR